MQYQLLFFQVTYKMPSFDTCSQQMDTIPKTSATLSAPQDVDRAYSNVPNLLAIPTDLNDIRNQTQNSSNPTQTVTCNQDCGYGNISQPTAPPTIPKRSDSLDMAADETDGLETISEEPEGWLIIKKVLKSVCKTSSVSIFANVNFTHVFRETSRNVCNLRHNLWTCVVWYYILNTCIHYL